jgi:hypothetical protein
MEKGLKEITINTSLTASPGTFRKNLVKRLKEVKRDYQRENGSFCPGNNSPLFEGPSDQSTALEMLRRQ